ncbi:LacI family DNA-binding transcriptional regulator [Microbacterium album]|uniref:LacI family transcriptional regulator n=1 Tax=Microbacterium album TaxID=2053191 RepID=A0A917IGA2_9MICO|nr:LacI family DNA-binding transcriptional regulator [Microbacterium album]GGH43655.1 LacI family transcriptional regulator [Microbacterium album]
MPRRVTIDDVARLAGVHKATVSRALNEATRSQVRAATVERVRAAADELGYVPDVVARGLRTKTSMTIGVIIPDLMNPIFPPIVRGIEHVLQPRGYTALLANTDGRDAVELAAFESLVQRRVDGFIVATGRLGAQPAVERAHRDGVFAVMVNREAGSAPYPVVTNDSESGMAAAVQHLVDLGHRRIAHLAGPRDFSTTRARADAFAAAARELPGVRTRVVDAGALTTEAGQRAMDELLARGARRPTAIIGGNDLVALGAIRSLHAHGLRVPEDVSVVGFNDMPFAADFSPSLTTVRVPLREMGMESARLLLAAIEMRQLDARTIRIPVSLVVRDSTGPCCE